jgi:hypothetical protein
MFIAVKSFVREFWQFIWARKLWWMVPMIIVLLVFGTLVILAQSSSVAPFIYVLF